MEWIIDSWIYLASPQMTSAASSSLHIAAIFPNFNKNLNHFCRVHYPTAKIKKQRNSSKLVETRRLAEKLLAVCTQIRIAGGHNAHQPTTKLSIVGDGDRGHTFGVLQLVQILRAQRTCVTPWDPIRRQTYNGNVQNSRTSKHVYKTPKRS